ncbi:MAG: arabinogalactan endo-beta-1,4-galactanase [Oscillospiraceae bacterium]
MKKFKMPEGFASGADISWYPQMLEDDFVFKNREGKEQDLLTTLKEYGMDSIRLRTWVNPSDNKFSGHCSTGETLGFAKECADKGFRIMLDFHYSDSWADPGQQRKPGAWENLSVDKLTEALHDYTKDTMELFVKNGVVPEWVQLGNETNPGMLLPDGGTRNFEQLAALYNAGHDGVKAVSPESKTMIHLAEFNFTDFIFNYFGRLEQLGCRYDVMGFSFYPYHLPGLTYEECMRGFRRSMKEIPERFGKDFLLVEIGGEDEKEEGSYELMLDAIEVMQGQPRCKGLFWWEPEGAKSWSGYPLSAWRGDGTPTKAMDAFLAMEL